MSNTNTTITSTSSNGTVEGVVATQPEASVQTPVTTTASTGANGASGATEYAKTKCALASRSYFLSNADMAEFNMGGGTLIAEPKAFSTGSLGWYYGQKLSVKIDAVSRKDWEKAVLPIEASLFGQPFMLEPKAFSTGSIGWNYSGKTATKVGDALCKVQLSINATVIKSKEAPEDATFGPMIQLQVALNATVIGSKELPE